MHAQNGGGNSRVPEVAQRLMPPCKPAQHNATPKRWHVHSRRIAHRAAVLSDDSRPIPALLPGDVCPAQLQKGFI